MNQDDIDKAQQIMDEIGYPMNPNGTYTLTIAQIARILIMKG